MTPKTNTRSPFGKRLRQAIEEKGLTENEVAKRLSLSRQAVSQHLRSWNPSWKVLSRYAELLNVDPGWLRTGKKKEEAHA